MRRRAFGARVPTAHPAESSGTNGDLITTAGRENERARTLPRWERPGNPSAALAGQALPWSIRAEEELLMPHAGTSPSPLGDDAAFLARRRRSRYALAMKSAMTPVLRRRGGWPFSPSVVSLCFLSRFLRHLTRSPSAGCRRLGISRLRLNRLRFGPARQRSIQGRGKRGLAAHEIGPRQFVALASSLRRQVQALRR